MRMGSRGPLAERLGISYKAAKERHSSRHVVEFRTNHALCEHEESEESADHRDPVHPQACWYVSTKKAIALVDLGRSGKLADRAELHHCRESIGAFGVLP